MISHKGLLSAAETGRRTDGTRLVGRGPEVAENERGGRLHEVLRGRASAGFRPAESKYSWETSDQKALAGDQIGTGSVARKRG